MKLSVVIPCYKDDPTRAIQSIKNQLYYDPHDIEIILCMDEPGRTLEYPNVITISTEVNSGPGVARQRGLDAATGEYVTFLDADDIWYNALGYALFLRDVYRHDVADIVKFGILEQLPDDNYNLISEDSTWCFGKIFRREFLTQNNIRFHPNLRVHEDSFFVRMAELCEPRIVIHGDAVYLWCNNPQSIVRRNGGEYWQKEFTEYIKVLLMLRDERIKRGLPYDGTYDLAYCYANICRMDEDCAADCALAMRENITEWEACATQKERLYECICAVERQGQLPRIMPKFTFERFMEAIRL